MIFLLSLVTNDSLFSHILIKTDTTYKFEHRLAVLGTNGTEGLWSTAEELNGVHKTRL